MPIDELRRRLPEAPRALHELLAPHRTALEPPIRAEIFGAERFAQHGRSLGLAHRAAAAGARHALFFPRLRSNITMLRQAHRYLGQQAQRGDDISPAAEWLLDNFHLIEAQLDEARVALPRRYYRALPVLQDEPLAGLPRIYGVAWAFVAHTDGAFDEELLVHYLCAYQETRELTLGEMAALPTTLRVVLIESLRRLAERVATNTAAREVANRLCDELPLVSLPALDAVLAQLTPRGVGAVFLAQLAQRVHEQRWSAGSAAPAGLAEWLQRALPDLAAVQLQQRADQTADNLSVSNAVGSLRAIGAADWARIVERASTLLRLMLGSALFSAEHVATRGRTLGAIVRLAQRRVGRTGETHSEVAVAQTLLGLMQAAPEAQGRDQPQHWLRGAGRPRLLSALGLREPLAVAARTLVRRLALPVYLGTLVVATAGLLAWVLGAAAGAGGGGSAWLALLLVFPASEAVVALVNRLISESLPPQHLPRLALAAGIALEHRVLVAVPAMLGPPAAMRALVHRLALHHLANPERHAQFALLTDGPDADQPTLPADAAALAELLRGLATLNERHPGAAGAPPRFILLHRERRFSTSEGRWIGWERKRGKLEALVAALAAPTAPTPGSVSAAGSPASAFVDLGHASRLAGPTPHLVTLDSDTQLPPGRLRELVGVAAHPLNQPRLDAAGRRVVAGYGILQPRLATPLPAAADLTGFHRLFAGQVGIDVYSSASSEIYQDLFSEGSFSGKGLLHVQAVHAVLGGRLPDERILSHDLLEGSIARCALVSDISLIEDAPFHADVAASRVHRWTRGDWQLLPLLLQPRRWPLAAINRWKMLDNLRRSLVAPMSLAALLLALGGVGPSPWVVLALVLAAGLLGPLMGALAACVPSRADIAWRHFARGAAGGVARALAGGAWQLAQLGQQAWMAVDAVLRALHRQFVSHRLLLQWTTAAAAQASARAGLAGLLRQHWQAPVLATLGFVALMLLGTRWWPLAAALCALWAASPLWTWWASRVRAAPVRPALSAAERDTLTGIAHESWRWFERCVGADDHHLPPDNLQTLPHEALAHRTSPTNIGLYLLSAACARQFGWIDTPQWLERLEATLGTLARLARHRGHFLNWYDTQTLAPLVPMYVSTVDSGNLCGHLLALAAACREQAAAAAAGDAEAPHAAGETARLLAAADTAERLAGEPDFAFLYHRRRHLLHIGLRVAEQQLDDSFYDLLASESRLTSLWAIAKGDVPPRHWAALGRPFFASGAQAGLRSWSGSMFEYLMPTLVLEEPPGSVLHGAGHAALREQIAFGTAHGVPWGISESAHAVRDHTLAYQYAPQGVPRLALRRTPPGELVVAPYATALAAMLEPREALANFARLQALGARAAHGFVEALDFTPARHSGGEAFVPVATFMAHHQGMGIVALANVLLDGAPRRWGMAHPALEAVASLLHERAPRQVPRLRAPAAVPAALLSRHTPGLRRELVPGATALAPTHLLGNGRYGVSLRPNGAGVSVWGAVGLSRWRDDLLRDAYGHFFFLRLDPAAATPASLVPLVSLTQHPAPDPAASYLATFHADRVCFDARWPRLHAATTVWVSPEDDIEFRRVELHNPSDDTLELELVSVLEPVLAEARADEAHPAFGKLFVRAAWHETLTALVFERRPRSPAEPTVHLAHALLQAEPAVLGLRLQADRQRWLGRNRATHQPLGGLAERPVPTGHAGDAGGIELATGLDPMCALAARVRIAPQGKVSLTFATAVATDASTLRAVIDKYRQSAHMQRALLMSATLASIRQQTARLSPQSVAAIQLLTTAVMMVATRTQAGAAAAAVATVDRRLLWRFGFSGERPLLLVAASAPHAMGLLRTLVQALRGWAWSGVACDLVVINGEAASYQMTLQQQLGDLRERHRQEAAALPGPDSTGLFVLRADELTADELGTLQALARVRLQADGRPLHHHVQEWAALHEAALDERLAVACRPVGGEIAPAAAEQAPRGRFEDGGGAFCFETGAGLRPLRPWINVLANPHFGSQLSEAGGGHTWAGNSRLNQLSAWSNDAVSDPPAEGLWLQDLARGEVWSVAPGMAGDRALRHHVAHGQGWSRIGHRRGQLTVSVTWCVDPALAVKQVHLKLHNHGPRALALRVVGVVEWLMGAQRSDRATVHTALHRQRLPRERMLSALLCTQPEQAGGNGGGTAFLATTHDASSAAAIEAATDADWTCDRRELFDSRGRVVLPDHLGRSAGSGLDPCAALATRLLLGAGEHTECTYLVGHAASADAARELAAVAAAEPPAARLAAVRAGWDELLGATTVQTPDPLFDALVNRWLLYQTVACRLWARAGFYQAGGAFGFRDQLQDAAALAWAAPSMLRAQIVRAAARQFGAGDVQHWWHEPGGAGVRTHFSDDLLWLPWAVLQHQRATGDTTLLDEPVPFLDGGEVPEGAEDLYETPQASAELASVYEHGARAIDRSLRVGVHGLPLIGGGDWNDGMNRVGHQGRGESVWLAWFLCPLVEAYGALARSRSEPGQLERADRWDTAARGWRRALAGAAWDGQWFTRAFFDDGQPLGSAANSEARIDLVAQAWSVLSGSSGAATPQRQHAAMAAVQTHLLDSDAGLLRLLHPPLVNARPAAGYIQAYPPGVRENGGQYAHAAVWALMAQSALGQTEHAWQTFTRLSPAHRAQHPVHGLRYGIEPYVMAGDIYTGAPYTGRGGWSWYTGAAAWMHRAAVESIFGLRLDAEVLSFEPGLPGHWQQAELVLRREGRQMRFIFARPAAMAAAEAAAPAHVWQLRAGEPLRWVDLPTQSCFLLALP